MNLRTPFAGFRRSARNFLSLMTPDRGSCDVFSRCLPAPPGPPVNLTLPEITGGEPLQCGETLTATSGTWSGAEPITFTYKWFVFSPNGGVIEVATGSTHIAEDPGTFIVEVTASNADGSTTVASDFTLVTCD